MGDLQKYHRWWAYSEHLENLSQEAESDGHQHQHPSTNHERQVSDILWTSQEQ